MRSPTCAVTVVLFDAIVTMTELGTVGEGSPPDAAWLPHATTTTAAASTYLTPLETLEVRFWFRASAPDGRHHLERPALHHELLLVRREAHDLARVHFQDGR